MRNPFRIRASQRSVSDEQFVRLFGPGALDVVDDEEDPFSGLVFFRSAPGGGKDNLAADDATAPARARCVVT